MFATLQHEQTIATQLTRLLFRVGAIFSFSIRWESLVIKTDPYQISHEFSAIFSILRVGKGRHLEIIIVIDSIRIAHIYGPAYSECNQYLQHSTVSTHNWLTGSASTVEYQSSTLRISRSVSSTCMSTICQHR